MCNPVYVWSFRDTDCVDCSLRLLDRYENPLVTAQSRQIITDINVLTRQFSQIDVPRPLAMFKTLFRPGRNGEEREPWFQALKVWSDIEDICDSDSFGRF